MCVSCVVVACVGVSWAMPSSSSYRLVGVQWRMSGHADRDHVSSASLSLFKTEVSGGEGTGGEGSGGGREEGR